MIEDGNYGTVEVVVSSRIFTDDTVQSLVLESFSKHIFVQKTSPHVKMSTNSFYGFAFLL